MKKGEMYFKLGRYYVTIENKYYSFSHWQVFLKSYGMFLGLIYKGIKCKEITELEYNQNFNVVKVKKIKINSKIFEYVSAYSWILIAIIH